MPVLACLWSQVEKKGQNPTAIIASKNSDRNSPSVPDASFPVRVWGLKWFWAMPGSRNIDTMTEILFYTTQEYLKTWNLYLLLLEWLQILWGFKWRAANSFAWHWESSWPHLWLPPGISLGHLVSYGSKPRGLLFCLLQAFPHDVLTPRILIHLAQWLHFQGRVLRLG